MNDKNKPAEKTAPRAAEGNVDQIRDILFGGQMRDYERRFEELEDRLKRESERARGEVAKRFESMEALLKEQADRSQTQFKRLEAELKQSGELLQANHEKLQKAWREQSQASDEKSDSQLALLRERLHKLANETADSMRQTHDELSAMIDRVGASLRDDKVAREELAGFFSEVALRLTRQFELPKSKA
jgi:DNA anti-recombination protein RmuC